MSCLKFPSQGDCEKSPQINSSMQGECFDMDDEYPESLDTMFLEPEVNVGSASSDCNAIARRTNESHKYLEDQAEEQDSEEQCSEEQDSEEQCLEEHESEYQYSEEQDSEGKEDFVNVTHEDFPQNCLSTWYPSIHLPSAPPLLKADEYENRISATMDTEPPEWIPDSSTSICMQCWAPFKPLIRCRHHCRFCGGIFCGPCTARRCLLPVKFRVRDPQRVCDRCNAKLEPLQRFLRNRVSNAVQIAPHDVTDWTCMRGWLNMPLGMSMEDEIYKSTNVLRSYCEIGRLNRERSIHQSILKGAIGLAVLTVAKAGMFLTYKVGTGLVIARKANGSWSAPSAIVSFGLGWGPQMGGELTDFVIVLRNYKAVKAFSGRIHLSFGAGISAAAGFFGRAAEADIRAGNAGFAACYTYSSSKGAFIGLSLEGNIVTTRTDTNLRFYGDPSLKPIDILLGSVERPRAAAALYSALDDLSSNMS